VRAYKDAIDMLGSHEVLVPNWYSEIAIDFFGHPSKVPDAIHNQIRSVLQNTGTVTHGSILNPFKWTLNVRCNERFGHSRCTESLPKDPCGDDETQETAPSDTIAYARNQPHTPNNAEITFCPRFFEKRKMHDAMGYGASQTDPGERMYLGNYRSQADYFLHELFHIDLAANSFENFPNPHILDVGLAYSTPNGMSQLGAYGAYYAKLLARYDKDLVPAEMGNDVGFYVQRNGKPSIIINTVH
jgi:hypothetical protein